MDKSTPYLIGGLILLAIMALYELRPAIKSAAGKAQSWGKFSRFIAACLAAQVGIFLLFALGLDVFGVRAHLVDNYLAAGQIDRMWPAFLPLFVLAGAYVWRWISSAAPRE